MRKTFLFIFISICFVTSSVHQTWSQNNEKELFLVAQKAFEDGFYDVAIRYIDQLFEQFPQTEKRIQANLLLGQCYFFQSQYLKAYDIFQDLLQYSEFKDATLFWLGETYLKGTDYSQAKEQYQKLIEVYPDSIYTPQAYYSLGWTYFEQEQFKKAKNTFFKLIKNFPLNQLSEDAAFKVGEAEYNLQSYENTVQYFKNYVIQYPKSTRHAEAYFYIAESYYYLEDFLTAATYYAKAAEIAYDNKLVLMSKVSRGWSYLKLNRFKLSQESFDEALSFAQQKGMVSDDIFLGQATLYSEMKDYKNALGAYLKLIEEFPKSKRIAEAYQGVANSHYLLKNYQEAIRAYKVILTKFSPVRSTSIEDKINADNFKEIQEKAYFGLAWSYLKDGDIDSSIRSFETIKDQTDNKTVKISALTQIGDAYQDVNQYSKAIEVYDQILKDYPESLYADYVQYRQGIALLKMDKIKAAILSLQGLQANFPDSKYLQDVKYYLAVAYFKEENWMSAKEQIENFINDLPTNSPFLAESHYILGLSYFNLEEFSKALKIFQKITRNHPNQKDMIQNAEINIAKCYYKMGQEKEAVKKFEIITNLHPQSETAQEALIWLGDHYFQQSDFEKSIVYYQQFADRFPGSKKLHLVYFELGQSFLAQKEFDKAVNIFKRIDASQDSELYARAKLAIADIFSNKLDPESAIQTYQNIIDSSPEFNRDAYVNIANVYKGLKDYEAALRAYQNALQSPKKLSEFIDAELQFLIGDTYELSNKNDQAVEEYLKISYLYSEQVPWIVKAYLRVARIFEDRDQWDEAKIIYNKIIKLQTDELKFAQERIEWINENTVEQN